jgi:two-component system CheB/CheR fusion protein
MNPSGEEHDDKSPFYDLVVMGASAGGIEALSVLVATLPGTLPVPIVIAQHLDPNVPSHLAQILARRTALPIRTVGEAAAAPEPLVAGTIYLVPADRDVEITDGSVRLQPGVGQHPMPSIDRLFSSAATVYGERAIAVVLTGSGSDGTEGARAIKTAGGTVLIENPQTASYPAMPASLPPTIVDLVVDLERIGPLLDDLISGAQTLTAPTTRDTLPMLLEQVRLHTNIDFTQYKSPTILRRLHRRMAATGATTLPEYLTLLDEHPEEYQHLVASFLINVTEFFRDPPLVAYLQEQLLPDLVAHTRSHGGPHEIRIWSAGCSTGEEPYSIAMLLAEALGPEALQVTVRIFATDVDADAIAFARRGRYPAAALANVPETLRARYFLPADGAYEISKAIRAMVIFGEHDLGARPPFPHMDVVLCRNVLIYFTPELQRRALQLFAFSLRDGGYLVLGNAESANQLASYFGQVHPHLKVYRRQGERVLVPPPPLAGRPDVQAEGPLAQPELGQAKLRLVPNHEQPAALAVPAEEPDRSGRAELGPRVYTPRERFADQILGLPIGVAVVDRNYDVLTINSAAYALLDIHRPAIGKDLLHLAERVPTKPLRAAIDELFGAPDPATVGAVSVLVELEGGELEDHRHLQVTCYPHLRAIYGLSGGTTPAVEAVVLFIAEVPAPAERAQEVGGSVGASSAGDAATEAAQPASGADTGQAETLKRLTAQATVDSARLRELRTAVQELREENDQLRRNNEDLVVMREELGASSEETKTLNEELQATNEELETLNEELEATVEELRTTNDELTSRAGEAQKRAEEKETQREAAERVRIQLAMVVASLGDAVCVVNADGQQALANEAYQHLRARLEVDGAMLEDEHGQPLTPAATPWQRVTEQQPFRMTFSARTALGARQWFDAIGQPLLSNGYPLGGLVTIRDLSDRMLRGVYERLLMQVGHELATPLATLLLTLQELEKRLPAAPATSKGEELPELLESALRQARQLHILAEDLADVGREQSNTLRLTREAVDLVALTQAVAADLTRAQRTPPIIVRPEIRNKHPIIAQGDPVRLEQALRNLLTNAQQYARESDRVDVRIRRIHQQGAAEVAELEVQDYGPGIPAEELPLLFMPFYQGTRGGVTAEDGLGLGLYLAQQLIRAHGGQIEVRSSLGHGTVFTIRLPYPPVTK